VGGEVWGKIAAGAETGGSKKIKQNLFNKTLFYRADADPPLADSMTPYDKHFNS